MGLKNILPFLGVGLLLGCGKSDVNVDPPTQVSSQLSLENLAAEKIPVGTWLANHGHCRNELVLDGMHEFTVSRDSLSSFGITLTGDWLQAEPFEIPDQENFSCLTLNRDQLIYASFSRNGLNYHVAFDLSNQIIVRKTNDRFQWFTPLNQELLRSFVLVATLDVEGGDDWEVDDEAE